MQPVEKWNVRGMEGYVHMWVLIEWLVSCGRTVEVKGRRKHAEHDPKTNKDREKIEVNIHKRGRTHHHAHVYKERVEDASKAHARGPAAASVKCTPLFVSDLCRLFQTCSQTKDHCIILLADSGPKALMTALMRFWITSAGVFRQNVAAS